MRKTVAYTSAEIAPFAMLSTWTGDEKKPSQAWSYAVGSTGRMCSQRGHQIQDVRDDVEHDRPTDGEQRLVGAYGQQEAQRADHQQVHHVV